MIRSMGVAGGVLIVGLLVGCTGDEEPTPEAGDNSAGDGGSGTVYSGGGSGGGGSGGGSAARGGSGGSSSGAKCSSTTQVTSDATVRDADGKGQVTQKNVCVPELGLITSISLRYMLSDFFGDPIRQAVFSYYADYEITSAFWLAQVMTTTGQEVKVGGKTVYVHWSEGAWPAPGGAWGFDATGSPNWNQTFAFWSSGTTLDGYVDETNAKTIYKAGFTLDRLRIVSVGKANVKY